MPDFKVNEKEHWGESGPHLPFPELRSDAFCISLPTVLTRERRNTIGEIPDAGDFPDGVNVPGGLQGWAAPAEVTLIRGYPPEDV